MAAASAVGVLIYLIVNHSAMSERRIREQGTAQAEFDRIKTRALAS